MTQQETREAREHADMIVKKARDLIALEDQVIKARETVEQFSAISDNGIGPDSQGDTITKHQEVLTKLESELKACIVELSRLTDELKWTSLRLRTYALPQMDELVTKFTARDIAGQSKQGQLLTALIDKGNTPASEQLEAVIIARLKNNLERIFSIK